MPKTPFVNFQPVVGGGQPKNYTPSSDAERAAINPGALRLSLDATTGSCGASATAAVKTAGNDDQTGGYNFRGDPFGGVARSVLVMHLNGRRVAANFMKLGVKQKGATAAEVVAALNGIADFSKEAVASVSSNAVRITSRKYGTTSKISIEQVGAAHSGALNLSSSNVAGTGTVATVTLTVKALDNTVAKVSGRFRVGVYTNDASGALNAGWKLQRAKKGRFLSGEHENEAILECVDGELDFEVACSVAAEHGYVDIDPEPDHGLGLVSDTVGLSPATRVDLTAS